MAQIGGRVPGYGVLTMEAQQVEVTSGLPRTDPNWRFTDDAGHEHYRAADAEPADRLEHHPYPTLRTVIDAKWWCSDCNDEHTDSHMECAFCGETITPGMLPPSMFREFEVGRVQFFEDGEPISPERAEEIQAALLTKWNRQREEIIAEHAELLAAARVAGAGSVVDAYEAAVRSGSGNAAGLLAALRIQVGGADLG